MLLVDGSSEFLEAAGAQIAAQPDLSLVGTARNAAEALDAVARLAPDLVIMDASIDCLDGFATTRTLKARRGPPRVVTTSAERGCAMGQRAMEAGADVLVAKSELDAWPEAIRALWSRPSSDAPVEQRAIDPGALTGRILGHIRSLAREREG